ncbi:unnamed protein product [Caenorhabditis bovis]|uniref:Uncharacterized protein n=1 Tax=Caenorhabditis bovis TaxID=2654633 RepID=A0A8S1EPH3_9PELO|nr:unnamed protein product [Caenorhabditis bovis]
MLHTASSVKDNYGLAMLTNPDLGTTGTQLRRYWTYMKSQCQSTWIRTRISQPPFKGPHLLFYVVQQGSRSRRLIPQPGVLPSCSSKRAKSLD